MHLAAVRNAAKHAAMVLRPTSDRVAALASSTMPSAQTAASLRRFLLSHVKTARSTVAIASRSSAPLALLAVATIAVVVVVVVAAATAVAVVTIGAAVAVVTTGVIATATAGSGTYPRRHF
jgi:hypothetical protein